MVPALSCICEVSNILIRPDIVTSLYIHGNFNFRIMYLKGGAFFRVVLLTLLNFMLTNINVTFTDAFYKEMNDNFNKDFFFLFH